MGKLEGRGSRYWKLNHEARNQSDLELKGHCSTDQAGEITNA